MLYSLTTTKQVVLEPRSLDFTYLFSAGKFSTAVNVYIAPQGSGNVISILNTGGATMTKLLVPNGVSLEAWTDAGTAELAVTRDECTP